MKLKLSKIDWPSALFLTLTPFAAIGFTVLYFYFETFNPWMIVLFVVYYALCMVSITGGFHRYFAHRAYEASKPLQLFYLLFGAAAFQSPALKWAADHRFHHMYVDSDEDPYDITKGFFWAHLGWMLERHETRDYAKYAPDLWNNKLVRWQNDYYLWIAVVMAFLVPTLIGWAMGSALGGFVFGGVLRMSIGHHCTFFINSFCHIWGKQTYTDKNSARDSFVFAVFTCGEGYHNYHHLFQNDYRCGIRWYHWDPTKWFIRVLEAFGFARKLKRAPEKNITRARMEMFEKRVRSRNKETFDKLEAMIENFREKVQESQESFLVLQRDYHNFKRQKAQLGREKIEALRADVREAKREFKLAYAEWQRCLNQVYQAA